MIELKGIHYRAGSDFELQGIDLSLAEGAFHVLLGPTGGGKTILLELIAGLQRPQHGSIRINSQTVDGFSPERRNIAYVPQDNAIFPHLDVYGNIAYGLRFAPGLSASEKKEKVLALARRLHIEPLLSRTAEGLSGGEQQRVALARALAVDKKIVLLDEPTSAVHESMQEELCTFLKQLQRQLSLTVIMTTHHRDSAFMLADYLHIIEKGRLALSCKKDNLPAQKLTKSAALFLGINNIFSFRVQSRTAGEVQAWCDALNTSFVFSAGAPWAQHDRFELGVRPEDVRVVKPEDRASVKHNAFEAEITSVLHKESSASIKLKPCGTETGLMMNISGYNQRKFDLAEGRVIKCQIKEAAMREIEG